jgi:hypothetical protein
MAKYQLKRGKVEAFRWTGGPDQDDDPEWIVRAIKGGKVFVTNMSGQAVLAILTADGLVYAQQGDYIVRDTDCNIYPLKPDVFVATYEAEEVQRD